jgi:hypothetical protein
MFLYPLGQGCNLLGVWAAAGWYGQPAVSCDPAI